VVVLCCSRGRVGDGGSVGAIGVDYCGYANDGMDVVGVVGGVVYGNMGIVRDVDVYGDVGIGGVVTWL